MTLVANVVIAPIFLKEVVSKRDVLSTMLIVAGCAVAVAFASHSNEGTQRRSWWWMWATEPLVCMVLARA